MVHANAAGAWGEFEVTNPDAAKFTCAKFLDTVGKKTPVLFRLSTTGGEKGSADTVRDVRGFSVKFFTEEGNHDIVGNHIVRYSFFFFFFFLSCMLLLQMSTLINKNQAGLLHQGSRALPFAEPQS